MAKKKYFSALTLAFYDSAVHGSNIPEDAVEITDEEYKSLISGQALGKQITADEDGLPVLIDQPLPSITQRREIAKLSIDTAAGNARQRYVSVGNLIGLEYQQAETATKEWRAAGSPPDAVPDDIQCWADAANMTAEQAATDIEQTATNWRQLLTTIRQIRLMAKAAVDAATDLGAADDMTTIAQPYIDQLEAMQP